MTTTCKFCNTPVVLTPSAAQRAEDSEHNASHFTQLFPHHSKCFVAHRSEQSRQLMRDTAARLAANRVRFKYDPKTGSFGERI